MSIPVYAGPEPLIGFGQDNDRPAVITRFGSGNELRSSRAGRMYRIYNLSWAALSNAQMKYLDDFYAARKGVAESFLFRTDDPDINERDPYTRSALALGAAVGAQVLFPLPTGESEYAGDYPINEALTLLLAAGVSVARTVQTDARTLTASVAPGDTVVMTATYRFYRRWRWQGRLSTQRVEGLWNASAVFLEVNT